jgi:hypothetical protein
MVRLKTVSLILGLILLSIYLTGCKNNSPSFTVGKTGNVAQALSGVDVLNTTYNLSRYCRFQPPHIFIDRGW